MRNDLNFNKKMDHNQVVSSWIILHPARLFRAEDWISRNLYTEVCHPGCIKKDILTPLEGKQFIFPGAIGNTWCYQYTGSRIPGNNVWGIHTWKVVEK